MTLHQLLAKFFDFLTGRVSRGCNRPGTLTHYRWMLRSWVAGLPAELLAADLKPHHLLGDGTASRHRIQAARRLTSWAVEMGLLSTDPFALVKVPRPGRRERILSPAELLGLYQVFSRNYRRFTFLMRHLICRPGELRLLRWRDVHVVLADRPKVDRATGLVDRWEERWIVLHQFKAKDQRKDQLIARVVPLDKAAACLLWAMRKNRNPHPDEPVFYSQRGEPLTRNAIRIAFRLARARAGLEPRDDAGERIVAYSLRHTAATDASRAGMGDRCLADIMGHTSTRTTARYQHLTPQHLIEAVDRAAAVRRARFSERN